LHARNDERLTLSIKAQGDFERVFLAVSPALAETSACAQSQAAILSVSAPEEQSLLHYRKGYCLLAGASITRSRQDYSAAAAEFDRAMDAWPARVRKPSKNTPVEPLDNGLRVLDAITHLYAENETVAQPALAAAVSGASCSAGVMTEAACRQWVAVGREWLGRLALRAGKVDEAAADFAGARETGWLDWSQGAQAFHAGSYAASASHYAAAIDTWKAVWRDPGPSFVRRMGPRPDLSAALLDLGAAQLLAGNVKQAESTLPAWPGTRVIGTPDRCTVGLQPRRACGICGVGGFSLGRGTPVSWNSAVPPARLCARGRRVRKRAEFLDRPIPTAGCRGMAVPRSRVFGIVRHGAAEPGALVKHGVAVLPERRSAGHCGGVSCHRKLAGPPPASVCYSSG
jgi:tetratricopeptide (TPR) repeat protein